MKRLFDRNTESRVFCPGNQVLALLTLLASPFCAKFSGPYTIVCQVSRQNYLISWCTQLCHVNLLNPFYPRSNVLERAPVTVVVALSVMEVAEDVKAPEDSNLQPRLNNSKTLGGFCTTFVSSPKS